MTTRVRVVVPSPRVRLHDTSPKAARVDPRFVQEALGATVAGSSEGMDLVQVAHAMGVLVRGPHLRPTDLTVASLTPRPASGDAGSTGSTNPAPEDV